MTRLPDQSVIERLSRAPITTENFITRLHQAAIVCYGGCALALVRIYVGLTAVQMVLLRLAGIDWFDSSLHAFGTLATGGFSSHSSSIAYFGSWVVEAIVIVFMFKGILAQVGQHDRPDEAPFLISDKYFAVACRHKVFTKLWQQGRGMDGHIILFHHLSYFGLPDNPVLPIAHEIDAARLQLPIEE